jgi:murein DD-endopeptidase MepM/ murein hydrolase activator NlpD
MPTFSPAQLTLCFFLLLASAFSAEPPRLDLRLPTANAALLGGDPADYFQYIDRDFEGQRTSPWEGGQFGFVRDPRRVGPYVAFARFHEGMDVKPLGRDAQGEPLDDVRAILPGEVVYVTASAGLSNYGRYIVMKHDWGEGPFYSLYAHLRQSYVTVGQKLAVGATLGRMGHTGEGIDQRRAHVHVELNLLLNSQFEAWHAANYSSPNHHGIYNGMNLLGLNIQELYAAYRKNPALSVAAFVRANPAYYELTVPGGATMEIANRYPWLRDDPSILAIVPPSWVVRCNAWGLPVSIKPGAKVVSIPQVTWVKDGAIPHYYNTRGILIGSGSSAKLTASGLQFVNLLCGLKR